jgi:hypothetical protein
MIIKNFLNNFIPGESKEIKYYKKLILNRWMNAFVISSKTARKIKKAYKDSNNHNNIKDRSTRGGNGRNVVVCP